jgi:hypothetical protein
MANDKIQIENVETGLTELIELSDEEQSNLDAERAAWLLAKNNALAEAQAKKAAAEAKLALLGLDADDFRALGL